MYGRLEAARLLLAAGADPTVPNHEGLTPMLATLSGRRRATGRAIAGLLEVSVFWVIRGWVYKGEWISGGGARAQREIQNPD